MDNALSFDLAALEQATTIKALRTLTEQQRDWMKSEFTQGTPVTVLVKARAHFIDQLLAHLWYREGLDTIHDVALVAVGGYGRGELHPHSDVDILVLSSKPLKKADAQRVGQFLTLLWDIRLNLGSSVRTVDQCVQLGGADQTIGTSLIEARLLCGAPQPFRKLQAAVQSKKFWPSDKLYAAKVAEQEERHDAHHDTGYNLEPNIKSNPGGLRDIQTIGWVAKRHFNVNSLAELIDKGFLTPDEYQELMECQNFLWLVRFLLHIEAGRAENRLLFDFQPRIAQALGYLDGGNRAVERMMKKLYQTIRRLRELCEMLMRLFDEAILGTADKLKVTPINSDFQKRGNLIEVKDGQIFIDRPESMLDLFLHIADDPEIVMLGATTIRALRQGRRAIAVRGQHLCDLPACRERFMTLLRHPRGIGRPFSRMHKHYILATYLPAWEQIVGQMQFDLFHAYTVDEHTYRLVQNIYHFIRPRQGEKKFPLCTELLRTMRKPELLFLGAIFHDIAKGRGGDHSELGAEEAQAFCALHGINDKDTALVMWLVENHLLMSVTAQKRDIHDPEVVREFAARLVDETHLDTLYCLTVADICATNDNLWNGWKDALLHELYHATQKVLRHGLQVSVDVSDRVNSNKSEALVLLGDSFSRDAIEALWARFYDDYFLRQTPEQIAWHCRHLLAQPADQPMVLISKHTTRGGTEIFLYTPDRANVFAHAVALFSRKGLNVHDAHIGSTRDGYVLDTFVVLEQDGEPLTAPLRVQEIATELPEAISCGAARPALPSRRLPRQMRHFNVPTQVTFLDTDDASRTMVELVTLDRPGVLAQIGQVFEEQQLNLHAAKITTIGERAEDFFILTTARGGALDNNEREQLKAELQRVLTVAFDDDH